MSRPTTFSSLVVLALVAACANGVAAPNRLAEPVTVSFESPLNLIVLETWIDGKGPFRFGLDSGATSTVIDRTLAKNLGLATGAGRTRQGTVADSEVTVAPVKGGLDFGLARGFYVHVDRVIAAPFTEAAEIMLGEKLHGIFGSAIFFRYVVEVDYVKRQVVFHEPADYRRPEKGSVLEIDFPSRVPKLPFLEPNSRFDGPRIVDRSGALLIASNEGETFEVLFVSSGTPADDAGLARRDTIHAVDGTPAAKLALNEVRTLLCREATYRLDVERDGHRFETVMNTRDLYAR